MEEYITSKTLVEEVVERQIEAKTDPDKYRPILTTIPELNRLIGGYGDRYFVIIGAAPKVGKSVTLISQTMSIAQQYPDRNILFLSFEMWKNQLGAAVLSNVSAVNRKKFRDYNLDPQDWTPIEQAKNVISTYNIYWAFTQSSIAEIKKLIHQIEEDNNIMIDILVIDYVQLMHGPGRSRTEEAQKISRDLKLLTRREGHRFCVIAASQLTNDAVRTKRYDHTAYLYGGVDRDCDIGLIIAQTYDDAEEEIPGERDIHVVVAREGEAGKVQAAFRGEVARVAGIVKPY